MTSTIALPSSTLRSWFIGCMLGVLAFGACWAAAIMYWRAREGDPSTGELMLGLFILPAALLTGALVTRARLSNPKPSAPALPAQNSMAHDIPASAPHARGIAAVSVRAPYGATVEELASALAAKRARPTLDGTLVDDAGYPILTARCSEADDPALTDAFAAWLAAAAIDVHFSEEDGRALILATTVATDLAAQTAAIWPDADCTTVLHLVPVLPTRWHRDQRHAAGMWLRQKASEAGWPLDRISLVPPVDTDLFDTVPALTLTQPASPTMVVACASHISDAAVQALPDQVPGEGAIGLLLTDPAQAGDLYALMEPIHSARRDTSADTSRGAVPPVLTQLASDTLGAANLDADALAMLVADTGPRTSRMLETMGYAAKTTPHLNDELDVITLGHALGACGAVPALTALALARHYALERNSPVLWLTNEDPFQRCAAVVRPPHAP